MNNLPRPLASAFPRMGEDEMIIEGLWADAAR